MTARELSLSVDLNCDLGEGCGDDAAMMRLISSANVACGGHAGDDTTMRDTAHAALAHGVRIGAHPSFEDREGFGRRAMPDVSAAKVERLVARQIEALQDIAALADHCVTHVKPHGALSNLACVEIDLARGIATAIRSVDRNLVFVVLPHSQMERAAIDAGLPIAREVYADRAYDDQAMLVPRTLPGAVLHDAAAIAARVLRMVQDREIVALSGKRIAVDIDTVCVHGDTPGAVEMARAIRQTLTASGVAIAPFVP